MAASVQIAEAQYAKKYKLLRKRFDFISQQNDKLRNRIYYIKKEIKYLKKIKRLQVQRLASHADRFNESWLEIPDSEPGANIADQIIAQVQGLPSCDKM